VSAKSLVETLRGLSHKEQVTVVATLHQPSSSIFRLFDDLLVLHAGTVLYHGRAQDMIFFYANAGLPCPEQTNPADWALDAISTEEGLAKLTASPDQDEDLDYNFTVLEEEFEKNYVPVQAAQQQEQTQSSDATSLFTSAARLNWHQQFYVLLHRSMRLALRERFLIIMQVVQTVLMAVLIGTAYLFLPDTLSGYSRQSSALFFCAINQGMFGALMTINTFPVERVV
jgi:ABC-type sulfate/molybdate transport systems ATPase subunit